MAPQTLRRETAGLVRLADRDLSAMWRLIAAGASAEIAMRDILPTIVETYGAAAATLAADWYDDLRLEAGAKGRFIAEPIIPTDRGTQSLIGWALKEASDDEALRVLIAGGTQRRIADHIRETIAVSSTSDPQSAGWKRIGAGACEFCRMLIERDQLYSEATADFASHDHCSCQAYPIIKGAEPIDVKDYVQSQRTAQMLGESDDAYGKRRATDRARVKDWLEGHPQS